MSAGERQDLPPHWESSRLDALFVQRNEFGALELPLLSVSAQHGVRLRDLEEGRAASEDLSGYRVVREGDLVVNRLVAREGAFGVARLAGLVSPAYWVLRPRNEAIVDVRYVDFALHSPPLLAEIRRTSKNMPPAQFDWPWPQAKAMRVPAPPRHEQVLIADFLEAEWARIAALLDRLTRARELLDESERRVADDVAVDAPRLRLGWVADVRSGLTLGKKYGAQHLEARPYLRVANVQSGRLDLSEVKEVLVPHEETRTYELREGDVLMTEGGDIDKLGRGTVWNSEIEGCLHQNHVFAIRTHRTRLLPEYLAVTTRTSIARSYFERTATRSTNLASTNSSKVRAFRFPVPDMARQAEAVAEYERRVEDLEEVRNTYDALHAKLIEYRSALTAELALGTMTIGDGGEPTSRILALMS